MISYESLYRELSIKDAAAERDLLDPAQRPPAAEWSGAWKRQHGLSPLAFQELLWRVRKSPDVGTLMRQAGTLHLGLSLLEILIEHGIATACEHGSLIWNQPLFPELGARHSGFSGKVEALIQEFEPTARFGQLQASTASSAHRVAALMRDLPSLGRSVLFLGDDDFTSLHLANALYGTVTVVDIDPRLLSLLGRAAREYELDLVTREHDVREPLVKELRSCFDSVHCDPVDDGPWLDLWLRAALAALAPVAGARLFLSINPRRLGTRYLGLHRFLIEMGFALEHRERDINAYPLAGVADKFYQTHVLRSAEAAWHASVNWAVHTDLLVFRYEGSAHHLWPQEYRELRRGV